MIQENWDDLGQNDVVRLMKKPIFAGIWEHDGQDNNGFVPEGGRRLSETIPIVNGKWAYLLGKIFFMRIRWGKKVPKYCYNLN